MRASPESFTRMRRNVAIIRPFFSSLLLLDALAEGIADEGLQGDRLAGLGLGFLEHLAHGLGRIVHEGLLQESDFLEVALQAALDDLLHDIVRLAGVLV